MYHWKAKKWNSSYRSPCETITCNLLPSWVFLHHLSLPATCYFWLFSPDLNSSGIIKTSPLPSLLHPHLLLSQQQILSFKSTLYTAWIVAHPPALRLLSKTITVHSSAQVRCRTESCCTYLVSLFISLPLLHLFLRHWIPEFSEERIFSRLFIFYSKLKLLVISTSKKLTEHTPCLLQFTSLHTVSSLSARTFPQSLVHVPVQKIFLLLHTRVLNLQGFTMPCRLPSEGLLWSQRWYVSHLYLQTLLL